MDEAQKLAQEAETSAVQALEIQMGSVEDAVILVEDTIPKGPFRDAVVWYIKNLKKLREEEMRS